MRLRGDTSTDDWNLQTLFWMACRSEYWNLDWAEWRFRFDYYWYDGPIFQFWIGPAVFTLITPVD